MVEDLGFFGRFDVFLFGGGNSALGVLYQSQGPPGHISKWVGRESFARTWNFPIMSFFSRML
jgi:hypothetical protein